MTKGPVAVAPSTSITDAATAMAAHRIRRLLVIDRGVLVGMITNHDVARAYPAHVNPFATGAVPPEEMSRATVDQFMAKKVLVTTRETPLEEAAAIMRAYKVAALPVMQDKQVVGIITESDIFRALVEMMEPDKVSLRITFDISESEDAVTYVLGLAKQHGMKVTSVLTMHHEQRRLAAVRLQGHEPADLVHELWRSGHKVLSVVRPTAA